MTKIILHGCCGAMGRIVTDVAAQTDGVEIVAGIDAIDGGGTDYPVFTDINACDAAADVIIDFSTAKAVDALLDFAVRTKLPLVLCTTGLSDEQLEAIDAASEKVAILRSANMSLGVNTLLKLVAEATRVFADAGFDIEIVEKHHRRKLDAPSGTAIALADAANEAAGGRYGYVYDRSGRREKRPDNEIGISAVRGGTIVGQHDVIFAGTDEVVELHHTAYSRAIFAKGAVAAARFLAGKPAGMYGMSDVIG